MEGHYSLDMACSLIFREKPSEVQICTDQSAFAKAVVRRLQTFVQRIFVTSPEIAAEIQASLGLEVGVKSVGTPTSCAIVAGYTFNNEAIVQADLAVLVFPNALSYKSVLYPGKIQCDSLTLWRQVQPTHFITERIGLFDPRFILLWMVSTVAGSRVSHIHFSFGQKAVDRIYTRGLLWWLSYIVILSARRRTA